MNYGQRTQDPAHLGLRRGNPWPWAIGILSITLLISVGAFWFFRGATLGHQENNVAVLTAYIVEAVATLFAACSLAFLVVEHEAKNRQARETEDQRVLEFHLQERRMLFEAMMRQDDRQSAMNDKQMERYFHFLDLSIEREPALSAYDVRAVSFYEKSLGGSIAELLKYEYLFSMMESYYMNAVRAEKTKVALEEWRKAIEVAQASLPGKVELPPLPEDSVRSFDWSTTLWKEWASWFGAFFTNEKACWAWFICGEDYETPFIVYTNKVLIPRNSPGKEWLQSQIARGRQAALNDYLASGNVLFDTEWNQDRIVEWQDSGKEHDFLQRSLLEQFGRKAAKA